MRRVFLCVRCQSACAVHRPNGTRARNAPSRIAPAPLRNRKIAFGGGRFPVRCISHRCVPLKGAVGRAVGTGARRFSARLHSATANPPSSAKCNPSAATVRLAWSGYLPAPIASVPAAPVASRRRIRSGPVPPSRPLDTLIDFGVHSGASVPPSPRLRRTSPLAPALARLVSALRYRSTDG